MTTKPSLPSLFPRTFRPFFTSCGVNPVELRTKRANADAIDASLLS